MSEDYKGQVVVCINLHGVAEAFGPFFDNSEAHDVADFAAHLVPTWLFDLDESDVYRYGFVEVEEPKRRTHRLSDPLPKGCTHVCRLTGEHAPGCRSVVNQSDVVTVTT